MCNLGNLSVPWTKSPSPWDGSELSSCTTPAAPQVGPRAGEADTRQKKIAS